MVSLSILASLFINISSSVGVIVVNKELVFKHAGFNYGTLLTIIHFVVTFGGCVLFDRIGLYRAKRLHLLRVVPISLVFCGYVVFNNLSLLTNSVSVYQVSKVFCTPLILLIEAVAYGKRERPATLVSLVPVCLGVFITVYTSTDLSWVGTFWAALAVVSNSYYTIWGKTKQEELQAQPMQLLLYQAPLSAVFLLLVFPFFDDTASLAQYQVSFTTVWTVLLSCVFAFGVNFSFFLFVRKTSPLTVNVVGYLKTALVFVFAFVFADKEPSYKTAFGVTLTLVGLAMYLYAKVSAEKVKSDPEEGSEKTRTTASRRFFKTPPDPSDMVETLIEGETDGSLARVASLGSSAIV